MRKLFVLIVLISCTSCTGYYYTASPHYVPLNTEKGEIKANIGTNGLQLGYAFADHFSLYTSAYYHRRLNDFNFESMLSIIDSYGTDFYEDNLYEINLGCSYFNRKNKFVYEVFFGGGGGEFEMMHTKDFYDNDYKFNMNSIRYNAFVQPNFGFKFNDHLELSISGKLSWQYFNNIKTDVIWGDYGNQEISDDYFINKSTASIYFLEPALTFKAGGKIVKAHVQLIPVINLSSSYIRHREISINLGLSINLNSINFKNVDF